MVSFELENCYQLSNPNLITDMNFQYIVGTWHSCDNQVTIENVYIDTSHHAIFKNLLLSGIQNGHQLIDGDLIHGA